MPSGHGITADKQWVGADTFGLHPGSVYASWIVFDGAALNTVVSVSTDYGAHFSAPQVISSATKPKFNGDPYVFEGPEGNVYVAYDSLPPKQSYTTGGFQVVVSHDNGQTWSKPGQQVTTSVGPTPYTPDTFRDGTPYSMTVNRRLACPANDPVTADIGLQNTCIDVSVQFYAANSVPIGTNRRVTLETWDPNVAPPQQGGLSGTGTFIGDYFGGAMTSTADGAVAHLLFVSTSTTYQAGAVAGGGLAPPYQQQIYARLSVP